MTETCKWNDVALAGALSVIKEWKALEMSSFLVAPLSGGLTNRLFTVKVKPELDNSRNERHVLVRLFGDGTEVFIDRAFENMVLQEAVSLGVAPKTIGDFSGGRVEQYLDSVHTLNFKEMHETENLEIIGVLMAKIHSIDVSACGLKGPANCEYKSITQLHEWWKTINQFKSLNATLAKEFFGKIDFEEIRKEIIWLQNELAELKIPNLLCHRDLQAGNILMDTDLDDIKRGYLIDFEYSGIDCCAFDYGNMFVEMAIDNFACNDSGFKIYSSMYPSTDEKRTFFAAYLKGFGESYELFKDDNRKSLSLDEKISILCHFADLGILISHLYWSLWGILQAINSSIDFNYLDYAISRAQEYFRLRKRYTRGD